MADFFIAAGAAASVVLLIVTRVRAIRHKGTCCGSCEKCGYCTAKPPRIKNTKYMDNDCN